MTATDTPMVRYTRTIFPSYARITCIHENKPKMISQITDIFKDANIENLMNKSKKDIAYTIIDLDSEVDISPIEKINGMIRVSTYKK